MTDVFSMSRVPTEGVMPPPPPAANRPKSRPDPLSDFAVSVYYKFTIDGIDLGVFTKVSGIGMRFNVESVQSGGGGPWVHQLVGRVQYDNLTLERAVNPDTKKVMRWLAKVAQDPRPTTAVLVALSPHGEEIVDWSLTGVVPVRWSGPTFDVASSAQAATETLELAYRGFL